MTDTQADLTNRASACFVGEITSWIDNVAAALQSEREAAAAEARGAAISDAAQVAIEYRDEADAGHHPDVGDPEHSLGQGYAANRIAKRILALASPQEDKR